jgi:hypothetical protein
VLRKTVEAESETVAFSLGHHLEGDAVGGDADGLGVQRRS